MQCLISDLNKLRFGQPELLPKTLIFAKSISFPIPRLYFFHFLKISDAAALSGELRCPLADFFLLNHHLLRACCYFILWKCKWISVHFSDKSTDTSIFLRVATALCNRQYSKKFFFLKVQFSASISFLLKKSIPHHHFNLSNKMLLDFDTNRVTSNAVIHFYNTF